VPPGAGEGIRGAPIDTRTGSFLTGGFQTELGSATPEALAEALAKLAGECSWDGHIGIGLPGSVSDFLSGSSEGQQAGWRAGREELERVLETATGCRVVALSGSEAAGYGELAYGSAKEAPGLVLVAVLGAAGFGVALFQDGVVVRGVDVRSITASWHADAAASPPPPDEAASPAAWAAWAERVDRVLLQLESLLHPQRIILGGSAARAGGVERLISLLTVTDRVPNGCGPGPLDCPCHLQVCLTPSSVISRSVVPASLALMGSVKGAAYGATLELRTRDALAQVRRAVGAQGHASSPQDLSPEQLRSVFSQFAHSGDGKLSQEACGDMLRALGVNLAGPEELRRVWAELGGQGGHGQVIGVDTWLGWWQANVGGEAVQLLLSQEAFEQVLAEEPPDRLVCLEVGMTYCRPCKGFEKTYKAVAGEYPAVKFLRINGNENRSCIGLARDVLGIRSTPAFYFFRNGSTTPVASHTGANEPRLREALEKLLHPSADSEAAAAAAATEAAPDLGKIDTRSAQSSGLAALLQSMAAKQREVDTLRNQLKAAEGELTELQQQMTQLTGAAKTGKL
jgi:predicted NBD/HSP70 family sugar kinase